MAGQRGGSSGAPSNRRRRPAAAPRSIYEKIGKGKHSVVYKGRKKKTIQYYAVKSVEKSQKARVLQEVRTMHALDHKNVLKFYAWWVAGAWC